MYIDIYPDFMSLILLLKCICNIHSDSILNLKESMSKCHKLEILPKKKKSWITINKPEIGDKFFKRKRPFYLKIKTLLNSF